MSEISSPIQSEQRSPLMALLAVFRWECKRTLQRFLTWLGPALVFLVVLFLTWVGAQKGPDFGNGIWTDEMSPLGAVSEFCGVILPLFLLLVPFLAADQVSQDLRSRTHELLMASALPSRAYTSGRYLAGLLVLLIYLLTILLAFLVMGFLLASPLPLNQNLDVPGYQALGYPAPQVLSLVGLWALLLLPTSVLVYSLAFFLGTLFPNHTNLVKILLLVLLLACWILGGLVFRDQAYAWNPTGSTLFPQVEMQGMSDYQHLVNQEHPTSISQRLALARQVEERMPDVSSWLPPRGLFLFLALVLPVINMLGFRRFERHLST